MGSYLSSPVTEKESEEGYDDRLAFGLSAMQGWRVSMEDAHIANLNIDHHKALFSVFDGHGGGAVAKYAAKHMPQWLIKMEAYKRGDYGTAIAECYYKLDELLDTEEGQAELRELAGVAPARKTGGGLFDELEVKLGDDKAETKAEEPKPVKPKLKKVDSSEEFRKSALIRHSVIPGGGSGTGASLETLQSGVESDFSGSRTTAVASAPENDDSEEDVDVDAASHNATGMGCTAVSVLIAGTKVTVANTGDSRCVMSRRGEATPLTLDHKPIIYEEAQRIIRAGGFVRDNRVNGALNVSRTIGDLDFKRNEDLPHTEQMVVATPDITDLELRDGDEFLILACDGIWDVLSNQEAVDFVRKRVRSGHSLRSICEAMCDACLAPDLKGLCRGADNMSVIVVLFKKHADLESFWHKTGASILRLFKRKS